MAAAYRLITGFNSIATIPLYPGKLQTLEPISPQGSSGPPLERAVPPQWLAIASEIPNHILTPPYTAGERVGERAGKQVSWQAG